MTPLEEDSTCGDGVASASAAINTQIAKGAPVLLPDGRNWNITTPLYIGAGQKLYAQTPGTALYGPAAGTTIKISSGGVVQNLRLTKNPSAAAPTYHIEHNVSNGELVAPIFENLQFEYGGFAIYTYAYGYKARDLVARNCRFLNVANPLFFESLSDGLIESPYIEGASGSGILFKSGARSRIVNPHIKGGTTGITMLGGQSVAGNGAWSFHVEGGVISDTDEEGVSFDCNGASPTDCTMRERADVASKTSDSNFYYVTLNAPAGSWLESGPLDVIIARVG